MAFGLLQPLITVFTCRLIGSRIRRREARPVFAAGIRQFLGPPYGVLEAVAGRPRKLCSSHHVVALFYSLVMSALRPFVPRSVDGWMDVQHYPLGVCPAQPLGAEENGATCAGSSRGGGVGGASR